MIQSPEGWRKGSNKRLNSEIAKNPLPTINETTSSPDSQKNVEKNYKMGVDRAKGKDWSACGICGKSLEKCYGHDTNKLRTNNEPIQKPKTIELPNELIFGFENKKVKFISEEKILQCMHNCTMSDQIDNGPIIDSISPERLKEELGL